MIDIEQYKPGDTLWFVSWVDADVIGVDERDLGEGLLFSGTIKSITLSAFEKMWGEHPDRKQYSVVFEEHLPNPDGSPIYGMTFYVGHREEMNQRCFATRAEAEASVHESIIANLHEAQEAWDRAQKVLSYCEERLEQPVRQVSWEAINSGFRLSTVMEKQAEINARP